HHFYSSLLYFRFREPYYALSRVLLVIVDVVTLIQTALDDEKHGALKRCAAMLQLHHGAMHMLRDLSRAFLPHGGPPADAGDATGAIIAAQWRRRFEDGWERLRAAGVTVAPDRDGAARRYTEVRRE